MIRDHQKNRIYSFFEWWVGIALNHYFDGIEVRGLDRIPPDVPVIFTSNHENALLDPLLIILAGPYQPFSVARSDVFKDGWVARFLHFIRMYPAYRPRDGREKMARNEQIFQELAQRLRANNSVLIFPEGDQQMERRLRPLVKGTFRFAFSAVENMPDDFQLYIVPVGITYEDQVESGHPVFVQFGNPINVCDYRKAYEENPAVAINQLRAATYREMAPLMMDIQEREKYQQVEFARRVLTHRHRVHHRQRNLRHSAIWDLSRKWVDVLTSEERPRHHWLLPIEQLHWRSRKLRVGPELIATFDRPLPHLGRLLVLLAFLPMGIAAGIFQLVPILLKNALMRKVRDVHFAATAKFGFGLLFFPAFALLIFGAVTAAWGPLIGAASAFALVSTFNFNRTYWRSWGRWRQSLRLTRNMDRPTRSELNNAFHQLSQALRGSM